MLYYMFGSPSPLWGKGVRGVRGARGNEGGAMREGQGE